MAGGLPLALRHWVDADDARGRPQLVDDLGGNGGVDGEHHQGGFAQTRTADKFEKIAKRTLLARLRQIPRR